MVAEAKGPLNYQAFIGLFADKLNGTDPEAMMMEAFKCLDNGNKGEFSISE
jgi:Ca2+-binding EF-hand superfamily protein